MASESCVNMATSAGDLDVTFKPAGTDGFAGLADRCPEVVARLAIPLERGSSQTPGWPVPEIEAEPAMPDHLEVLGCLH